MTLVAGANRAADKLPKCRAAFCSTIDDGEELALARHAMRQAFKQLNLAKINYSSRHQVEFQRFRLGEAFGN
jgi:hypothetical protein